MSEQYSGCALRHVSVGPNYTVNTPTPTVSHERAYNCTLSRQSFSPLNLGQLQDKHIETKRDSFDRAMKGHNVNMWCRPKRRNFVEVCSYIIAVTTYIYFFVRIVSASSQPT
jgi:hypothetical protein